jgi:hypothetical protein
VSFDLFNLVPAVYRIRDAQLAQSQPLLTPLETARLQLLQSLIPPLSADQQAELDELTAKAIRGPLQSLLMLIEEQLAVLAEDLDQLYDDQFIETCAPWVIPYIGDLIGYQSVKGIAPAIDNPRSEVADTISFRRRKGTVLVMEQLARDATAWGAHAVEFFRVLGDTQYMNHIRPWNHYAPDLRHWKPGLYIDRGFDRTSHRVDVRRIASNRGRYNIQNVGIFLWSLRAYSVTRSPATATVANPLCMRFSSLGMDMPLFHRAVSQGEEITDAARPVNVADRLRRRVLCADVQKGVGAEYYGEVNSLAVHIEDRLLNPYEIEVANLSGTDGAWVNVPAVNWPYAAIIDPELGRIAVPPSPTGAAPRVNVSYYYGFNADMGGGEYARESSFTVEGQTAVFHFPDTASVPRYLTLQAAIDFAIAQMNEQAQAAVEITASHIYPGSGASLALVVDLPAGCTLELRAADGVRPTLLLSGEISVSGVAASSFAMNGLLIAADAGMMPGSPVPAALVHVPALRPDDSTNHLGTLLIRHCTLVPGWSVDSAGTPHFPADPTLIVEPSGVQVQVQLSILGAVRTSELVTFNAAESIIDATDRTGVAYAALDNTSGAGALTLTGCTVVGKVHATLLSLVSNSIFWAARMAADTWATGMISDRKQQGCVRFSFLPEGARTPRRFECLEQALASPQPIFFAFRYGHPGYLKLLPSTPDVVRRGADDGGEMGAFHFLLGPQRETDLRVRMQEYLPVGLEFGVIYQN